MKRNFACPVCRSLKHKHLCRRSDDRYGYPGSYWLEKCINCSHVYLLYKFSAAEITKMYSDFYPRSEFNLSGFKPYSRIGGFVSWLQGRKSLACYFVPNNVRVLDIGCGLGEAVGYLQSEGCDAYGIDVDPNVRRVSKEFGYNLKCGLFHSALYRKNFFDYIIMDQLIEHVPDPVGFLIDSAKVLKRGGKLILSTPNFKSLLLRIFANRSMLWHTPYHLQYWHKDTMRLAAERSGFRFDAFQTSTNSEWLFYQLCHYFLYPHSGEPSPFFDPRKKRTVKDQFVIGILFCLHQTRITSLCSRLLDALELGDNSIYFLTKK